ncbi:MAG TPA: hypothetical protein VGM85_03550 [Paraburkholderia sp.]|jgi:hypothetical protein
MDEAFQISSPETATAGDYLTFTILDGSRERPGRITGAALALLGQSADCREVFLANFERIREAAYLMSKKRPGIDLVILGVDNFQ